jgi:hypothetical protein
MKIYWTKSAISARTIASFRAPDKWASRKEDLDEIESKGRLAFEEDLLEPLPQPLAATVSLRCNPKQEICIFVKWLGITLLEDPSSGLHAKD